MSGGAAGALAVWLELHSRPLWLTHNSLRDFEGRYGSSSRDSIVCARARAARRERSRRDTRPCGMRAARDGGAETANPKRKAGRDGGSGPPPGPGPVPGALGAAVVAAGGCVHRGYPTADRAPPAPDSKRRSRPAERDQGRQRDTRQPGRCGDMPVLFSIEPY